MGGTSATARFALAARNLQPYVGARLTSGVRE
jgi:hypothetical protein